MEAAILTVVELKTWTNRESCLRFVCFGTKTMSLLTHISKPPSIFLDLHHLEQFVNA